MKRLLTILAAATAAATATTSIAGAGGASVPDAIESSVVGKPVRTHPVQERVVPNGSTGLSRLYRLLASSAFAPQSGEDSGSALLSSVVRRGLQDQEGGDWDAFNKLFENAEFALPDVDFDLNVAGDLDIGAILNVQLYNIKCFGIRVGDIQFEYDKLNSQELRFEVDVINLDLDCSADYTYKFSFFPEGKGSLELETAGNNATTELIFTSEDFDKAPPTESSSGTCVFDANVDDITFMGNVFTRSANLFKESIGNTIEGEIEDVACAELGSLGTTLVGDVLDLVVEFIAPHLVALPSNLTDPLYFEKNLSVPDGADLFNFNDTDTMIGKWINDIIDTANDQLGSTVDDPSSPTGNGQDLFINQFIRSNLLDDDRGFILPIEELPFVDEGGIVLDVHDNLTETVISVSNMRLFGLDTFTRFEPLSLIGNYTFQSELDWEYTTVQLDVMIDIKPSTLPDSIITTPGTEQLLENVRLTFGVQNIKTAAAFFVGFDAEVVRTMELSSLLNTSQILGCAFSALSDFQVTGLDVEIENIQAPELTNFISPGVNRIIGESLEVVLEMYEATLLRALPNIFQTTVRDILNDDLIGPFLDQQKRDCAPIAVEEESPIDFRSLLLPPDVAESFGGSSEEPYGDLFRILKTSIIDRFVDSEPTRKLLDIDVPDILESVIDQFVGNASGFTGLNELIIGPLTKAQSNKTGTLAFEGDLINTETNINVGGFDADIKIRLWDARIENLDTMMSPTSVLDPVSGQPYELNNVATAGSDERPLRVAVRVMISIAESGGEALSNEMDIHLNMHTVRVVIDIMLKMMDERMFQTPLGDLMNFDCWIATVAAPMLDEYGIRVEGEEASMMIKELLLSVSKLGVNVTCISCSSPGFSEFTEMISTTEATEAATDSANRLFEDTTDFLKGSFLQMQLDRLVNDASKKCERSPNYDPNFSAANFESTTFTREEPSTSFLTAVGLAVLITVACVAALTCVIRFIVNRRHSRWLESFDEEETEIIRKQQSSKDAMERAIDSATTSMFQSKSIPIFIRFFMPVIIVGNVGLFLSGHLSLGATVNIEASLAGENVSVDNFFEFSMAQSAIDIWNAGGKVLALLLLIFSGLFPYSKQLATLAMWFLPPSITSSSRRGSILVWLDWLAKWSMIDIFVLVVSIAAFRVTISSPDVVFLPENFYSVDLLVVPMWGLWSNFLAQIVSQVSSHFILYYHRKMVSDATTTIESKERQVETELQMGDDVDSSLSGTKENDIVVGNSETETSGTSCVKLAEYAFSRVCKANANKLVARSWVDAGLALLGVLIVALIITGCTLPAFSLDVLGAVGIAIESGQDFEEATTYHSIFTVVKLLMDEARFLGTTGAYIGMSSLSAVVIFCVLLAPIIQTIILLFQWFVPLTMDGRMRIYRSNEVLQAWQYGEVYLISIFVASWQLGPISEFMINSYCDSLGGLFSDLVLYGLLDPVDAQCFRVDSRIEPGFFYLAGGTILLTLLSTFVNKATIQFLFESEQQKKFSSLDTFDSDENSDEPDPKPIPPTPVLFTDTFRWCLVHHVDKNPDVSGVENSIEGEST